MKKGDTTTEKNSTIRVRESTKDQLKNFDFAKKGMSYDEVITELLNKHKKRGHK